MRKVPVLMVLIFLLVAVVAPNATSPIQAQDGATTWQCPEGYEGQTLSIYGWATYIGENTIPDFEALCGVEILYDVTDSNENTLTRLREGNPGWDVVIITDFIVQTMVEQDLLEEINHDLIPNLGNIGASFVGRSYDPENTYTIPYQWGTTGVGYNIEAVGGEITSWEQVWEHDGPVSWPEDPRYMIGVGLQMLDYDPNTTDEGEIEEAAEYLIEQGSNVVAITPDDGQVLLAGGNVDIALEYSGDIVQIIEECECDDFAYALPEEGANIYIDNLAIPTDAPNAELAHVFIDYILDPQVGADISNEIGYGSPNQASLDNGLIDEKYLNNGITYLDDETLARLWSVDANVDIEEAYIDAWDQITIFIGQ